MRFVRAREVRLAQRCGAPAKRTVGKDLDAVTLEQAAHALAGLRIEIEIHILFGKCN